MRKHGTKLHVDLSGRFYLHTLPETNYPFSGAMLVSGRVFSKEFMLNSLFGMMTFPWKF